jgi:hypothetical protein
MVIVEDSWNLERAKGTGLPPLHTAVALTIHEDSLRHDFRAPRVMARRGTIQTQQRLT